MAITDLPVPETGAVTGLAVPETGGAAPTDVDAFRATAGSFRRGFRSGANSVGGMLNSFIGGTAEALGMSEFAESRFQEAKRYTDFAEAVGPDVRDLGQITDFQSLVEFATGHAGSGLATTVPVVAAAVGLRRPIAGLVGKRAAPTAGVVAGAGALEAGEQVQTLRDDPTVMATTTPGQRFGNAVVKGVVAGTMEAGGGAAGMAARRLAAPAKTTLKGLATDIGKGTVGEAVTEAGQDLTGQALHKAINPAVEIDPKQTLNAAAAGAAGGGLITGGAALGGAAASGLAKTPDELRQRLSRRQPPADPDGAPDDITADDDMETALPKLERHEKGMASTYGSEDPEVQRQKFAEADAQFTEEVRKPAVQKGVEAGDELLKDITKRRGDETQEKFSKMTNREDFFKGLGENVLSGKKIYAPASNKEVADFLVKNNYKEEKPGAGVWVPATQKLSLMDGRDGIDSRIHKFMVDRLSEDTKKAADPKNLLALSKVVRELAATPGALGDSPVLRAFAKAVGEDTFQEVMNYAIEQVHGQGPASDLARQTSDKAFKERKDVDESRLKDVQDILRTFAVDAYRANPEQEKVLLEDLAPELVKWIGSKTGKQDAEIMEKLSHVFGEKFDQAIDLLEGAARPAQRGSAVAEMADAAQGKEDSPYVDSRLGQEMTADKAQKTLEALKSEYGNKNIRFSTRPVEGKPGMYILDAHESDLSDLDEAAWDRVREKKGYHGLRQGVLTVESYTRNKFGKLSKVENKINLVELTSEMMRQEKQQPQQGGAKYVADMFSRGITALLTAKINKAAEGEEPEMVDRFRGFKAEDLSKIPDNAPIGYLHGKKYTWADLRRVNFGMDDEAVQARRDINTAKTPEQREAGLKRLQGFYDARREQSESIERNRDSTGLREIPEDERLVNKLVEAATGEKLPEHKARTPRFEDEAKDELGQDVVRREYDKSGKKIGGGLQKVGSEPDGGDTRMSETLRGQTSGAARNVEEDTNMPVGEGGAPSMRDLPNKKLPKPKSEAARVGDLMGPLDTEQLELTAEERADPDVQEFIRLENRVMRAEFDRHYYQYTAEQREALDAGDSKTFSKLSGYTPEETAEFLKAGELSKKLDKKYGADFSQGVAFMIRQATSTPEFEARQKEMQKEFQAALKKQKPKKGDTKLKDQKTRLKDEDFFSSLTKQIGDFVKEGIEAGEKLVKEGVEAGEVIIGAVQDMTSPMSEQDIKDFPKAAKEINQLLAKGDPDGLENKIRRIYNSWQNLFKIPGTVLLLSDTSLARLRTLESIKSLSPEARRLAVKLANDSTKGINGSVYQMDEHNAVVYMADHVLNNPVAAIGTAAHEFGHILDYRWFTKNAPAEVRRALALRFSQWLDAKDASPGGNAKYKMAMRRESAFPLGHPQEAEMASKFLSTPPNAWETAFTEWLAEQTAKYMMQNRESLSPVEQFFHDFGAMLRNYLQRVRQLFAQVMGDEWFEGFSQPPSQPDKIVKEYLDAHLAGRESRLLEWAREKTSMYEVARSRHFDRGHRITSVQEGIKAGVEKTVLADSKYTSDSGAETMWELLDDDQIVDQLVIHGRDDLSIHREFSNARKELKYLPDHAKLQKLIDASRKDPMTIAAQKKRSEMLEKAKTKFSAMNIGREESSVTSEQKKEVEDYIKKVLGPRAKAFIEKMEATGSFAKLGGVETIKISVDAIDPQSAAYHEAVHAFMLRLLAANPKARNVLLRAANAPHIVSKLKQLLKDHPEALKQLSDPEERVAYMYQFWASGHKGLLNVGPETKTWFEQVKGFFKKVRALWADELNTELALEDAETLLTAFHKGEFANPNTVRQVLQEKFPLSARERLDKFFPALGRFVDKFLLTAGGAVRDMNIPELTEIMDKFYVPTGEPGGDAGFIQTWRTEYNRRFNKFAEIVKPMSSAQQSEFLTAYRAGQRDMQGAAEFEALLDEAFTYMTKAGVKVSVLNEATGKVEYKPLTRVKGYVPRVPNMEYLLTPEGKKGFIELLAKHGQPDPEKVWELYTKGPTASDPTDDTVIGLTFFAPQTNRRGKTMASIPDSELEPYLSKNPIEIMSQYLARSSRRAEYTRRFGNSGENIRAAILKAKEQGMTADQERTFNEAVQAMEGTLGSNMSDGMKALVGGVTTYQNLRLLPLALFSSLVDPLGIVVRGGTIKEAGHAFFRAIRNLVNENQDDKFHFARLVGTISAATDAAVMQDMYASQFMPKTQQIISDAFFKLNGMESWNRSMRTMAASAAEQFIIRHATEPGEHSARYLDELGLKPSDVVVHNGRIEVNDKVVKAINLWVDQAILRPNAAVRPIYMSDPHWVLVSHLKQYMYLFQKTIIARVHHELQHGNYTPAFALAGYVPAIIAADMLKVLLTPGSGDDREDWDTADWLWSGVQRAGIFGPGQVALDSQQDMTFNKIGVESIAGPTAQQILDFLRASAQGSGVVNELQRAIPGERFFR